MDESNIKTINTDNCLITLVNPPILEGPILTKEQRKAIHEYLIEISKNVMHGGTTKGLNAFIRNIKDLYIQSQIHSWLSIHSPIQVTFGNDNIPNYNPKKGLLSTFDLTSANLDPYYSLAPRPLKVKKVKLTSISKQAQTVNLSDREFEKKIIRGALEELLRNPTDATKSKIAALIQSFDKAIRRGSPTVSGGLPGLGKHR